MGAKKENIHWLNASVKDNYIIDVTDGEIQSYKTKLRRHNLDVYDVHITSKLVLFCRDVALSKRVEIYIYEHDDRNRVIQHAINSAQMMRDILITMPSIMNKQKELNQIWVQCKQIVDTYRSGRYLPSFEQWAGPQEKAEQSFRLLELQIKETEENIKKLTDQQDYIYKEDEELTGRVFLYYNLGS